MTNYEDVTTLVELLRYRAEHHPEKRAYTLLVDGEFDEVHITYKHLDSQARAIATKLQKRNCIDQRVLLLFHTSLEYLTSFFGCLYAGAIPIPAFPPRLNRPTPRIQSIVMDSGASIALTSPSILSSMQKRFQHTPELKKLSWLGVEHPEPAHDLNHWQEPSLSGDSLAYIQYTSGSTSSPKGVMLKHSNVLKNLSQIQERLEITQNDLGVLWGPLFHDMGLVTTLLALASEVPLVFMPPISFVQKPLRWLQAISRYAATISGGPNFGYQFCVDRIPEDQLEKLDLSNWKVALSGAEPIRSETLEQFTNRFSAYGFCPESFCPAYGLAEATLVVSMGKRSTKPTTLLLKRLDLEQNLAVEAEFSDKLSQSFVGCGSALSGSDIAVVNPDTFTRCPPDRVGEIWVSGPSIAQGYWNQFEVTERTFRAQLPDAKGQFYLRTGDLGFMRDGMLFITGRLKDLIIIRGSNYYPQDIESTAQRSHAALQPDGCGVFSVPIDGEEQLVVVHELKPSQMNADVEEVSRSIRIAIAEDQELPVYAVALVKPRTIPRTSSGKIQHRLCRKMFLDNELNPIGLSYLEDRHHPDHEEIQRIIRKPRTAMERSIAEVWSQVLDVKSISMDDNFFELGGQSLLATMTVLHLRERLQVDLPLRSIFDLPTIEELAEEIDSLLEEPKILPITHIEPIARDRPVNLSYAQERMWFLHQLDPGNSAYNIPAAIRLRGNLNWQAMEKALQEIFRRHEPLRTTFPEIDGQPFQVIEPYSQPVITSIDLRDLPETQRETRAIQIAEEEASRPFNLSSGPLIRFSKIQLSDDDHLLVFNLHHIICDAWALSLFERELITLYNAYESGNTVYLPEPRVQYADFAAWQRTWLQNEVFDKQMEYWRKKLNHAPIVELPHDFPRPPEITYRGSIESFDISETLLDKLTSFCHQEEVTLFMVLIAAFKVLLFKYTGYTDITTLVPIANRNWLVAEPLVGTLVNTLPLRVDLSGNPTFRALLKQVREASLEAYSNQDIPFAQLVSNLQTKRDLSHAPFSQFMFNVVETTLVPLELNNLQAEEVEIDRKGAQFDLALNITNTDILRRISAEYNLDLFKADTISRLLQHYQVLIENILADPTQAISSLSMLTAAEKEQLLVTWNDTSADYPRDSNIVDLLEVQVNRNPTAPAYMFEGNVLSFQDLSERANQLAHYLRFQGVEQGDIVGLYLNRSLDFVIALFGILKAGGVYLPLDVNHPLERLTFMLDDAGVGVVITKEEFAESLRASDVRLICLDIENESIARQNTLKSLCPVSPNDPAYVMYTSGTTGKPKGIIGTHRGAINRFAWMWQTYPFEEGEVCCQKTSVSFVDSIWELLGPLLQGIPTVIIPELIVRDTEQFVNRLAINEISRIVLVPSQLKVILDTYPDLKHRLPKLRTWISSGETLPVDMVQKFHEATPNSILLNLYGSTEVAADVTYYDTAHLTKEHSTVPIGRPIANTTIYLLDENKNLVPVGVSAEIYVGGDGLALGYLNHPELTNEAFIQNPFHDDPNGRLYRTGDIGRFLPDGNIELIGRHDNQVKIRGYRVELQEIEAVLTEYPSIKQAVVLYLVDSSISLLPSNRSENILVAYVVKHQATSLKVDELRDLLNQKLPSYMIPSIFIQVEDIPLTTSGKTDRRALLRQKGTKLQRSKEPEPARDAIEHQLVEIWEDILGLKVIGLHDDFFDIGGHSLLAIRLFSRIEAVLGVKLPIATIFHSPTVKKLAKAIRQEGYSSDWFSLVPLQAEGSKPPLFLIHGFGGGVLGYGELARLLETDQPVYGVPAKGYEDGEQPHTSIKEMAAEYIRVLRTVQPTGPYYLAGYSYGGVVAFEMANQLHTQKEQTALLVNMLGYAPNSPNSKIHPKNVAFFIKNCWYWLNDYFARPDRKGQFLRTFAWMKMAYQKVFHKDDQPAIQSIIDNIVGDPKELSEQELILMKAHVKAIMDYEPSVYPGNLTLFRVRTLALSHWSDPQMGWGPLVAGGLEIREVPGAHYNILEPPHVEAVSQQLKECLSKARMSR